MFLRRPTISAAPLAACLLLAAALGTPAQERRAATSKIDVEQYTIDAEISPNTQSVAAKATVRFIPLDDGITSASFELNNALNVSRVVDGTGKQINASRNQQDFSVRLSFDQPLAKGQPVTITFTYDGKLTGQEDSPVYGIKFAAIHPEFAYLMYPARWFPVSGYSTDRFAADMRITVPMGYSVVGSGIDSKQTAGDKNQYEFKFDHPSFPGSIAVVKDQPSKVQAEGVTTSLYFRGPEAESVQQYGEEIGKIMSYFTGMFGLPPYANLTVVETEAGAPNGYAAPGLIFLAPAGIVRPVSDNLLANQISRQWWEELVSGTKRNDLWLTNGIANYSQLLWTEHVSGPGAMETALKSEMVGALTIDSVPINQSARLEDYSPELWALTGSKGAAVMSMLRFVIGDEKFFELLKGYTKANAWKSVNTDDFRKAVETVSGQDLGYFFIQWIESSGAPEFKLEYTIFRTQKGFRVMGKISQDLDTFRMPVDLKIETEGNPEEKRVDVVGTSSEFVVDTFGKPKNILIDPGNKVLRYSPDVRVAVAIRRGEQFAELSEFSDAIKEYQKALETQRNSSLALYRIAEIAFLQQNWQTAANQFREALNGDLQPKWTEVWAHINLGKIFDVTGSRDRAVNEYNLAIRTKDDTQGAQEEAAKYLKTPYERQRRVEQ
ncbi:Peptidase M1, membrane alanine aminopeptidase [Candidatus Sulfopaludibacter sp. SbA4]|nr:Peptidase M1, membrane alanine aminopeptidase [Candidatus Sulfopaludibacter sp. SbA4]